MSTAIGMTCGRERAQPWNSAAAIRAAAFACALLLPGGAPAQESPKAGEAAQPPAAQAPGSSFKPGFIEAVGRWLEEGATKFKSEMQGAQENFDKFGSQAREAAKDATGTIMGLPQARPVTGRERCAMAQNGAPDCQQAADTICRGKGFKTGKSVDTQSERQCPARVLLLGRAPSDAECPTEMFVTRAMCQ